MCMILSMLVVYTIAIGSVHIRHVPTCCMYVTTESIMAYVVFLRIRARRSLFDSDTSLSLASLFSLSYTVALYVLFLFRQLL